MAIQGENKKKKKRKMVVKMLVGLRTSSIILFDLGKNALAFTMVSWAYYNHASLYMFESDEESRK